MLLKKWDKEIYILYIYNVIKLYYINDLRHCYVPNFVYNLFKFDIQTFTTNVT